VTFLIVTNKEYITNAIMALLQLIPILLKWTQFGHLYLLVGLPLITWWVDISRYIYSIKYNLLQ